jgi:hypothetical protein
MPLPDLITSDEYLAATGTAPGDVDSTMLDQIAWAITATSQAIRDYTDRDFVLTDDATQGPRTFVYEGGFELEIDDAIEVTSVAIAPTTFDMGRTLDATEWFGVKSKDGTIDRLQLFTLFGRESYSPEMGFRQNLDTLPVILYPVSITVTATWGWNEIPPNVKQAAVWGVADFMSDPQPYNSESIANYSHTLSNVRSGTAGITVNALPDRALALLEGYLRWQV